MLLPENASASDLQLAKRFLWNSPVRTAPENQIKTILAWADQGHLQHAPAVREGALVRSGGYTLTDATRRAWLQDPRLANDLESERAKLSSIDESNYRDYIPWRRLVCHKPRNPNNPTSKPCNTRAPRHAITTSLLDGVLGKVITIGWMCPKCHRNHHIPVDLAMIANQLQGSALGAKEALEKAQKLIGGML